MKDISKAAGLSRIYTNHQVCKTTATGMRRSGFTLEQIALITKHKHLDSLKHYVDAPTLGDKENYNDGLFAYAQNKSPAPTAALTKRIKLAEKPDENQNNNKQIVPTSPSEITQEESNPNSVANTVKSVITNQLRQAPNLFQNANFNNCNFIFNFPQ